MAAQFHAVDSLNRLGGRGQAAIIFQSSDVTGLSASLSKIKDTIQDARRNDLYVAQGDIYRKKAPLESFYRSGGTVEGTNPQRIRIYFTRLPVRVACCVNDG